MGIPKNPPTVMAHQFKLPWKVCHNEDAYWLEDATGMGFAYTYFRDKPVVGTGRDWRTKDAKLWRLTVNFAKVPALLGRMPDA